MKLILRTVMAVSSLFWSFSVGLCEQPLLKAVMLETPPMIDGELSDACWQLAAKATDFYHIESGTLVPEPTTAWLAYDAKNVYVAFECKDSQPDMIAAQQTKRGGVMDLGTDDHVSVILDPFSERRGEAFSTFSVNALGTQSHKVQSTQTGKTEWIGDWDAAVKRSGRGYTVEMRIPFSILKYDRQNPKISVGFTRYHMRLRQVWYAPDLGRNCDWAKFYFWDGVKPPTPRLRPTLLAYSLIGTGSEAPGAVGVDLKHSLTPSLTGLLTVNPDFRNIEQEVDSVDFTYTERVLSEGRPFFSEGSAYFPGSTLFYTRRIGEIDAGAKLVGLAGDWKLALLNATRFGDESYSLGQVGRQFGRNGDLQVWACGILSDVEGADNLAANTTIWYKWRHTKDRFTSVGYSHSIANAAIGSGEGTWRRFAAYSVYGPRRLNFGLWRYIVDRDFDPYLAAAMDKGVKIWNAGVFVYDEPQSGAISRWRVRFDTQLADRFDGSLYYNAIEPEVRAEWRDGRYASLMLTDSDRPPNHDRFWTAAYAWGQKDLYRAGDVTAALGKLVGGDYTYLSLKQGVRLSDRLSLQLWTDYRRIREPSTSAGTLRQTVLSAAYDITQEKGIVGRLIRRSGRTNLYFAYRQHVRAGLDAYLIYGDPNSEETRDAVLLKLIRPI